MISLQSTYVRNNTALITTDAYRKNFTGTRWVIGLHGAGGDHQTFGAAGDNRLPFVRALVEAGFVIISTDATGLYNWGGPGCQAEIDACYALGLSMGFDTKCDITGGSMGGLGALTWLKNNSPKVRSAVIWQPALNLDYMHTTAYGSQIDLIYPNYVPDADNYDPYDNVASFVGLGVPVRIYHGYADVVAPVQYSRDFVANAGAGYELVEVPGGHGQVFDYAPHPEVVRWMLAA